MGVCDISVGVGGMGGGWVHKLGHIPKYTKKIRFMLAIITLGKKDTRSF